MTLRPRLTSVLAIAATLVIALLPLLTVLNGVAWLLRVGLAALAAVAVSTLIETTRPERDRPVLPLVTLAGAVLWSLLVVRWGDFFDDPLSASVWGGVFDGFFSGWSALLSITTPNADQPAAETFLVFLVWFAGASSIHVAASRRSPLAAVVLSASLLWVAAAAALPEGTASVLLGAAAGAAALFTVATVVRSDSDEWQGRRIGALAAMIGVVALGAALIALLSEPIQRDPLDPRVAQDVAFQALEVPDLLTEYGARRDNDGVVFTAESVVGELDVPLRFRLQTYGTHDGRRFLPVAEYTEVGQLGEPSERVPGETVQLDVTIRRLPTPFIPLLDRVIGIDVENVGWDPDAQLAIRTDRPFLYRLTGTVLEPPTLDDVVIDRASVDELYLELPVDTPEIIRTTALRTVAGAANDGEAITAITAFVRGLGRDESVATGHSLGRLRNDLDQSRSGSAEQLATIHALMLRAAGYPSRVVVGYLSPDANVVPADLHVWTEIPIPGLGWAPIDPVPAVGEEPELVDEPATTTTLPSDSSVAAQAQPRELGPGEEPDTFDEPGTEIRLPDLLPIAAGAAIFAFVGLIVARLWRRNRRRNARNSDARTLGAWAELVDRLREAGAPINSTSSVADVVGLAADVDDGLSEPAESLGRLAAEVFHGPVPASAEVADHAWNQLESAEEALRAAHGRRVTARRIFDPRVLRYRDPIPPQTRSGGRRERTPTGAGAAGR